MKQKFVFSLFLVTCILSGTAFSQVIDSSKLKYDTFVSETKDRSKDKYTYSQFAISLRYRDTLGLNTNQIDTLYKEVRLLKEKKNDHYKIYKSSLDTRHLESQRIGTILTPAQQTLMLRLKNHSKAINIAQSDWKELELRNLTEGVNQVSAIIDLYEYYIKRESIYDKFRHDPIEQSKQAKEHYQTRPLILKTLSKNRKSSQNNTLGKQLNGN